MKMGVQLAANSTLGLVAFGVLLFWPAATFDYWQAWLFIAVFALSTLVPSFYLLRNDPAALRRRMHAGPAAETRPVQKIIIIGAFLLMPVLMVFAAFDHRFGWSPVPAGVSLIGAALVGVGIGISEFVIIQNSYAAANITVEAGQHVVSTGLYAIVRHPMYGGVLIMLTGAPLTLGSWWGLLILIPGLIGITARIRDEESLLTQELDGYREYTQKVRYRLVPYVW